MANTRTITKALAGAEDLLFGQGSVTQTRGGQPVTVNKINAETIPYSGDETTQNVVSTKTQLDKLALPIESIQDFSKVNPETNPIVYLKSTYAGANEGAGIFVWDANTAKTEHNGGTIIDPLVDMSTWTYESTNTGQGVWKRQYEGAVYSTWFGGTGYDKLNSISKFNESVVNEDIVCDGTVTISTNTKISIAKTVTNGVDSLFHILSNGSLTLENGNLTGTFTSSVILNEGSLSLKNVTIRDFNDNSDNSELYIIKSLSGSKLNITKCHFDNITGVDNDNSIGGSGTIGCLYLYNESTTSGINIEGIISGNTFKNIKTFPSNPSDLTNYFSDANPIRAYSYYSGTDKTEYDSLKLVVSDNRFIDNNQMNLKISNCGGLIVNNNLFINTGVEAFTGENNYKLGVEFRGGSVVCSDNNFTNIGSCIVVDGKDGYNRTVSGNTIFTYSTAISISCDNAVVTGNKVYGNDIPQVYTEQATIILSGSNAYFDNGGIVENVNISNNSFQSCSFYVGDISGCIITDNILYGVMNVKRISSSTIAMSIVASSVALQSFTGTHYIDNCTFNLDVRLGSLEENLDVRSVQLYSIKNSNITVDVVYKSTTSMNASAYLIDLQGGDNNKCSFNVRGNTDITFTECVRINSANTSYDSIRIFKDNSTALQVQQQDNVIIDNYWDNLGIGTTNIKNYSPTLYVNTLNSLGGGIIDGTSSAGHQIGNNFYRGVSKTLGTNIRLTNLPTSDPKSAGQLWNNSGTLTVSAG